MNHLKTLFTSALLLLCLDLFADFTLDKQNFTSTKSARHDNYVLEISTTSPDFSIAFGYGAEKECAILRGSKRGVVLQKCTRQGMVKLAEGNASQSSLTIRNYNHFIEVLSSGKRLISTMTDGIGRGEIGCINATVTSYQRLEPITFGDDFMRTDEEAKEWGLWQPVSGNWLIHSVMERIHANPAARIRAGREPVPDRSPNPFCIAGSAESGEALIITGQPFWCQYEVGVSVRPAQGAAFGLAFSVQDQNNLWLFRWSLPSLGMKASTMELVQRKNGKETVHASKLLEGRAENWQRLSVALYGNHITAFLDGVPALQVKTNEAAGGKIGLYCMGDTECRFDDVQVKSITELELEQIPASAIQQISGKWELNETSSLGRRNGIRLKKDEKNSLPLVVFGYQDMEQASIEAMFSGKGTCSLVGAWKDKGNYWLASCTDDNGGTAYLERVANGKSSCIAKTAFKRTQTAHAGLYYTEEGHIEFRVNGELVLRAPHSSATQGQPGLALTKGMSADSVKLLSSPRQDWERPVEIERFANDPFMQGWASTRYAWIRQGNDDEVEKYPQRHLFTGDIYGALKLDVPLLPNLSFLFGSDELSRENSYAIDCKLEEATGNGSISLSRCGKEVAQGTFTGLKKTIIEGTQIIDEKIGARPRTPDTPSYGKLSITRDGRVIYVCLNGKELFSFTDAAPLTGRALETTIPFPVDFIHFGVRREKLLDYLFEQAETDWGAIGRWEVTNRFACDPRWSHQNGESRGTAAIWSKFQLPDDYTIECFAGMRMRQGDFLEGAKMSYPRIGDINVALNADGTELFSGYNFIVAAWDKDWSEKWSCLYRKTDVVAKNDVELIPRGRHYAPKARAIKQVWDPGGRPVHGAWYSLKIRKTGAQYEMWFDQYPVFSFKDPSPLSAGKRIALWTQHNSIVIARMKVGYRQLERTLPIPSSKSPAQPPSKETDDRPPVDTDYTADFSKDLCGLSHWNGDQSAELNILNSKTVRAENVNSGGDFGVLLPFTGFNIRKMERLSFALKNIKGASVNLYVTVAEYPQKMFFVPLTGPMEENHHLVKLCPPVQSSNIALDLARLFEQALPYATTLTCDGMVIGMLHEGYLNAGSTGNHQGASFDLAKLALKIANGFSAKPPTTTPADNGEWGFTPISIAFDNESRDAPNLNNCTLTIGTTALAAIPLNSTYDVAKRTLTFLPLFSAIPDAKLNEPVTATFKWKNILEDKENALTWTMIPKPSADNFPPTAPIIDPSLCILTASDFKTNALSINKETSEISYIRRDDGLPYVHMKATVAGSGIALSCGFKPFHAANYPVLLFDYAIQPETFIDLKLNLQGRRFRNLMGMTDMDIGQNLLQDTLQGVVADGQWHTAQVNLLDFVLRESSPDALDDINWLRKELNMNEIAFGNFAYCGSSPSSEYKIGNIRLAPAVSTAEKPLRISWASTDTGGIKGYAVLITPKEPAVPEKTITHTDNYQDINLLEEGLHFVNVMACDKNGNWGAPSHSPIMVCNQMPSVATITPADGIKAAPREIQVTFNRSNNRLDFSNAVFLLNGKEMSIQYYNTHWDEKNWTLRYEILKNQQFRTKLENETPFAFEIKGLSTELGRPLPPVLTNWKLDYTQDKTPPDLPNISTGYGQMSLMEHFTIEKPLNNVNLESAFVNDEILKSRCLEARYKERRRQFVLLQVFDRARQGLLRFRYCIPAGVPVSFIYRVAKDWKAIGLTEASQEKIMAKGIVDDGKWHVATIDMKELLGETYQTALSSSIGFGSINEELLPKGSFRLDDVCFISSLPPVPMLYLGQYDETGIGEAKCKISRQEKDVPEEPFVYGANKIALSTPGTYFIHANITDGAGNTSETLHLPFLCETAAPKIAEDGLEATPLSRFHSMSMKGKSANILKNQAIGEDGNTLLILTFSSSQKFARTLILTRYQGKELLKGLSLDVYGQRIASMNIQAIAFPSLKPGPLKALQEEESPSKVTSAPVELFSKGEWQRDITLPFKKPLNTPPEYIGLLFTPEQKDRPSIIIDNLKPITQ